MYLYKDGDECIDVTGGWEVVPAYAGYKAIQMDKHENYIYTSQSPNLNTISTLGPKNIIKVTDYTKLNVKIDSVDSVEKDGCYLAIAKDRYSVGNNIISSICLQSIGIHTLDVSSVSDDVYIYLQNYISPSNHADCKISNIWLEK